TTHYEWKSLDLRKSYGFGSAFLTQLRWTATHLRPGDKMMVGTVYMNYLFYFEPKIRGEIILWPQTDNLDQVQKFIRDHAVTYGILDLATVAYNIKAYSEYFQAGPKIGLRPAKDMPPPFQKVFEDPEQPTTYEIYTFS